MRRYNISFIICLVVTFWSVSSYAVVVGIDSFSVSGTNSSGVFGFTDSFSDGTPPPCGPNGCATQPTYYGVNSTSSLPAESNGFLQLDSSNGIQTTNATGGTRLNQTVTVSGVKSQLLSSGGAISMEGIFTLPTLSGPLNEGYGIRFVDAAPGAGPGSNQASLDLNVQWWTGNATNPAGWYIRYLTQDFSLNTISTIGTGLVAIPSGADEIYLSLDRAAGSNLFTANYAYVNGGTVGALTSLGSTQGFTYNDYVRGQFHAFETVVPVPAAAWLFGSGLLGLVGMARRKKK